MIIDISDIVTVITGSSRGIGRELVRVFAKEKSKVVINYNSSKEDAMLLFKEISEYNSNCLLIKADVTNPIEVSAMYHEVIKKLGRVDILINNAGVCDDNLVNSMTLSQWKNVIDVNLTGTFLCCREFSKIMIEQRSGKIINISSLKGQEGSEGQANYSSSKAGMITLTKSLAKELGKFNVTVNAVCPGFIVTDLNRDNEKKKEVAQKRNLFPIDNNVDDLMNFLIYMSSNKFKGISGRVFNLDSRLL